MPLITDSPPLSSMSHSSSTNLLKSAIMSNLPPPAIEGTSNFDNQSDISKDTLSLPNKLIGARMHDLDGKLRSNSASAGMLPSPSNAQTKNGVGAALTDTPATTAPNSPKMYVCFCVQILLCYVLCALSAPPMACLLPPPPFRMYLDDLTNPIDRL